LFYRGIRETDVGGYWKRSVCFWELCERKVEGGFLYWSPERYVKTALETGISFHRGPVEEPGEEVRLPGSLTELKGALKTERLCLRKVCKGNMTGGFFYLELLKLRKTYQGRFWTWSTSLFIETP